MVNENDPIRIVLADDHELYRRALREWLAAETDFLVVGEAREGNAAIRLAEELQPDVVVMDVGMPGLNGIQATRQILKSSPAIRVIALSLHDDRGFEIPIPIPTQN